MGEACTGWPEVTFSATSKRAPSRTCGGSVHDSCAGPFCAPGSARTTDAVGIGGATAPGARSAGAARTALCAGGRSRRRLRLRARVNGLEHGNDRNDLLAPERQINQGDLRRFPEMPGGMIAGNHRSLITFTSISPRGA